MKNIFIFLVFIQVFCVHVYAKQSTNGQYVVDSGVKGNETFFGVEKRFAILIGNSDYPSGIPQLPNCKNDVVDLAESLKKAGFDVLKVLNEDKDGINNAVNWAVEFYQTNKYDVALVYFSGHGAQYANFSMFAPSNFTLNVDKGQRDDLNYFIEHCIIVPEILNKFNTPSTKCVLGIVDACRSYDYVIEPTKSLKYEPILNKLQKYSEGDGKVSTFFATASGRAVSAVAKDGRHSNFTGQILEKLKNHPSGYGDFVREIQNSMKADGVMPIAVPYINHDFKFYIEKSRIQDIKVTVDSIFIENTDGVVTGSRDCVFYLTNTGNVTLQHLAISGSWNKNDLSVSSAIGTFDGLVNPFKRVKIKVLGAPVRMDEANCIEYIVELSDGRGTRYESPQTTYCW